MTYLSFIIPFIYFGIAWFFPWERFQWDSSISVSYVFDIIFVLIMTISFRLFNFKLFVHIKGFISRAIAVIGAGIFSLFIVNLFGFKAPFKYIDHLFVQILILAPIVEELVFRHAFFGAFDRVFHNKNYNILLNSILFSLSHLPGVWFLPVEFRSFIYIQLVYTFLIGWICAKSRMKSRAVYEPIILHFIFNFIFYMAVMKGVI